MKIAYLTIAHGNPKHLARLVAALSSSRADFFLHIDLKSDILPFAAIEGQAIRFSDTRISVYWEDYSIVEATLILLRSAFDSAKTFDRIVLLSGADFPVRTSAYIEEFFELNSDVECMNLVAMPCDAAGKPISRLNTYTFRPQDGVVRRFLRKGLVKLKVLPRHRDPSSLSRRPETIRRVDLVGTDTGSRSTRHRLQRQQPADRRLLQEYQHSG